MLRINPADFAEGIARMDEKITTLRCMGFDTCVEPDCDGDYFVKMRWIDVLLGGVESSGTLTDSNPPKTIPPIKPLKGTET